MRLVFWNLQKKGLAKWAMEALGADIGLFQEHWLRPNVKQNYFPMSYTAESFKKRGSPCGTAVYLKPSVAGASEVRRVKTTIKENFISVYKTAIAVKVNNLFWVMSVHNYNGWPFRSVEKFSKCIVEFLNAIPDHHPAIVAGDFNSFTQSHLDALDLVMMAKGFYRQVSIEYSPGKVLDHVYARSMTVKLITKGRDESDHPYGLVEVEVTP